ncbi:MAG: MtrB/PioB family outer membrane beta-barrel protein [Syntrophobacteraceae bacterium]
MKIQKAIPVIFLAVMLLPLTPAGGFAQTTFGGYNWSGDVEIGGRFLINSPNPASRGYLEEYTPLGAGAIVEQMHLLRTNDDGSEYYKFFMSHPGDTDEDFLLQFGKIGLYKFEFEYDQFQHVYCTVNPTVDDIMVLWQRLRISGDYTPTPECDLYGDYTFLKKDGQLPWVHNGGPGTSLGSAYGFTAMLAPVDYTQNDFKFGGDYAKQICQYPCQFHLGYDLSLFQDDNLLVQAPAPIALSSAFASLPMSNMAQYVTGSGAVSNLPGNTRVTGSFTYGWLTTQGDTIFNEGGKVAGSTDLSASTASGYLSLVSRPCDPLVLRLSYRIYDFENDNLNNPEVRLLWAGNSNFPLALAEREQYSYVRQSITVGADYKINSKVTADVEYTYDETDRNEGLGTTSNNIPKVGVRLYPCDWMTLMADYAHVSRTGDDPLSLVMSGASVVVPLTYRYYAGSDERNMVNFIAELIPPVNNVTCSVNFNLYDDQYSGSEFGLVGDNGWSAGADVGWTPCKCVSLALGYSHEHANTNELVGESTAGGGIGNQVIGDAGPVLTTCDQYDTVSARAEILLIPDKLSLLSKASVSFSESDFHNPGTPNLDEFYFHVDTWLKYKLNKCTALKLGYIYERFDMTSAYQVLYLTGTGGSNQSLNTLDGFYTNYTAHVVEALIQYKF